MLILFDGSIGFESIGLSESGGLEVVLGVQEEGKEAEDDAFVIVPRAGKRFCEGVIVIASKET